MINMSKIESIFQTLTCGTNCKFCPLSGALECPIQYEEWTSPEKCQKALNRWISTP